MSQLQKSNLLRLLRRYAPRNDRKDAICHCDRSAAIPFLNTFAITSCTWNFIVAALAAKLSRINALLQKFQISFLGFILISRASDYRTVAISFFSKKKTGIEINSITITKAIIACGINSYINPMSVAPISHESPYTVLKIP